MTPPTALSLVPEDEPIPNPVQPYVEANPASVLLYPKVREAFLAEIAAEIDAFKPDLSTKASRAEIASLAYKVARTKTPIEAAAKALTEDFRKRTAAVNAERSDVTGKLDALRDRARDPLNAWEEAEKDREAKIKETFDAIDAATRVLASDTGDTVKARIVQMEAVEDNEDFHDARERALDTLTAAYERIVREEADRAELAKLRAEADERRRQEEERARAEAERLAAERHEQEETERKAREAKAAQERVEAAAKRAAEEAVAAERSRAEQAAAEEKRKADAELARLAAEKRKLEEAEAARIATEKRAADEQAARDRDKKHRAEVMGAAKAALIATGSVEEGGAKAIILAIAAGKIPGISIKF